MCASPSSGMIAAPASAIASRSTTRAASSGSPSSTSCRPALMWEQIRAGARPAAALGVPRPSPRPKPEQEIGRDPVALFRRPHGEMVEGRHARARSIPRALAAYRQSCNEPSRIHAFCEDYRAGAGVDANRTRPTSPPRRTSPARRRSSGAISISRAAARPGHRRRCGAGASRRTSAKRGSNPAISSPRRIRPAFSPRSRPSCVRDGASASPREGEAEVSGARRRTPARASPPRSRRGRHRRRARGGRSAG